MREIITPFGPPLVADAYLGPARLLEQTAALALQLGRILKLEAGKNFEPRLATALDHRPQLIGSQIIGRLHHPHNPPVDITLPDLLALPHDPADLALVKVDVSVPQTEHQQIHARAQDLVDRPIQLVQTRRRLNPLGVKMVRVIVVDESRFLHGQSAKFQTLDAVLPKSHSLSSALKKSMCSRNRSKARP